MTGAELFDAELRTRIDQTRAAVEEAARALVPDLAPNVGAQRAILAERHVIKAHLTTIAIAERMTGKQLARRAAEVATLADSKRCLADNEASGAAVRARAQTKGHAQYRDHEEAAARELAADWVRGDVGGPEPGGVIEWKERHKVEHVRPLPIADGQLATSEADLAAAMTQLRAALDGWDRYAETRATTSVELPPLESRIEVGVRES